MRSPLHETLRICLIDRKLLRNSLCDCVRVSERLRLLSYWLFLVQVTVSVVTEKQSFSQDRIAEHVPCPLSARITTRELRLSLKRWIDWKRLQVVLILRIQSIQS